MVDQQSRFESDAESLLEDAGPPAGWSVDRPDPGDRFELARLTSLLRDHERHGRGWPGAGVDDVLVEVSEAGLTTRENVVVRDPEGLAQAWGSVHDRAGGRMLFVHVVARDLAPSDADRCSRVLLEWADGQALAVGEARGLERQQIDTGAFAGDERQARWLTRGGYTRVRTWWQMSRPVTGQDADRVPDPADWQADGVRVRALGGAAGSRPSEHDLRLVHDVLEESFRDHFNSHEETFAEFVHRLREDPGHRWDHWWLAEDAADGTPFGALVGAAHESAVGPGGSYVDYLGVREVARGRGVATRLLDTIVADAARRGRDRVGLEVDADSPTGAERLYRRLGWETRYVTESWHRYVDVERGVAIEPGSGPQAEPAGA